MPDGKGATRKFLVAIIVMILVLGSAATLVHAFTNGQSASLVIGQKDFSASLPSTSRDGLYVPSRVHFDHSGNLWVVDYSNNRVLEFVPPFATGMSASLVIGQTNFKNGVPTNTASGLRGPTDLAFDSSGNLWIADAFANRVLEYYPPFSSGMSASLVIGQSDFTTSSGGTTPSKSQTHGC